MHSTTRRWFVLVALAALMTAAPAARGQPLNKSGAVARGAAATTAALQPRTGPPSTAVSSTAGLRLTPRQFLVQASSRLRLQLMRGLTLPAHLWPFNKVAKVLAHGEPFAGLGPRSAARLAQRIGNEGGKGIVVGRLAPSLRDIWSVRGAERSFMRLVDQLGSVKARDPRVASAIAFDPDSFGFRLAAVPRAQREQLASEAMLRIAQHAKAKGVGIELDVTTLDGVELTTQIARRIVRELKVPVRLAISARHQISDRVLQQWATLARQTGIKLGVRLVKGSYVEDLPGCINARAPLMQHYRDLITSALKNSAHLDVAVASQNEQIWRHAQGEGQRLDARYSMHVIRGVNAELQAKMRAAGQIGAEYASYGVDAPVFGLSEVLTNRRERRAIIQAFAKQLD